MHASTNPWQLTASRECLLGNYNHLHSRWGLSIGFQRKPHYHCTHASTNPWQLTASRECLVGNYTTISIADGAYPLVFNVSPIITARMQAQTHGSSQQAESASWVTTTISIADGAYPLVFNVSPIITARMQAQTHGSSQQAESASWVTIQPSL